MASNDTSSKPATVHTSPSWRLTYWLAIVLLMLIFLGIAYLWRQNLVHSKELIGLQTRVTNLNENQAVLQTAATELKEKQNGLAQQLEKTAKTSQLALAIHAIKLAHLQWMYLKNPSTALHLLAYAKKTLAPQANNPTANILLIAINQDQARLLPLKALEKNVNGQFKQAYQQLDAMQYKSTAQFHASTADISAPENTHSKWSFLKRNLNRFENLITIHTDSSNLQPMVSASQFALAQTAIKMQLSLAQSAWEVQDLDAFQAALDQAAHWVNIYFANLAQHESIVATLNTLKQFSANAAPYSLDSYAILEKLSASSSQPPKEKG